MDNRASSAENFDIFEDIRIIREQKNKELEAKKTKIMQEKAKIKAKMRAKTIFAFIIVFALACTVLYRNALIIQLNSDVTKLQDQLEDIKSENVKKELALEKSVDLTYVEEVATRKLGMKRPDKFQTVYVDVTQNNYAELKNTEKKDNKFYGTFSVINYDILN